MQSCKALVLKAVTLRSYLGAGEHLRAHEPPHVAVVRRPERRCAERGGAGGGAGGAAGGAAGRALPDVSHRRVCRVEFAVECVCVFALPSQMEVMQGLSTLSTLRNSRG